MLRFNFHLLKLKKSSLVLSFSFNKFSFSTFNDIEYTNLSNLKILKLANPNQIRHQKLILDRNINSLDFIKIQRIDNDDDTIIFSIDNFLNDNECKVLCNVFKESSLQDFMVSPGERKITGDTNILENIFNEVSIIRIENIKERIKKSVRNLYDKNILETGCIISWLCNPIENIQVQKISPFNVIAPKKDEYSYWSAHCDKANNNDYDISALLYLNNDFEGGDLIIMDDNDDLIIQPKSGRLVLFKSCIKNIHRVQGVTNGNRFLLSTWYGII